MLLARKLKSAVRHYRSQGMTGVEELARINAAAFYRSHRLVPADPSRRVRLLSDMLNRWSGVSRLVIAPEDGGQARDAVLVPYLRHRFAAAAVAAAPTLRPVEVAILADCRLTLWDFRQIDDDLPGWTEIVRGTHFAGRIAEVGRRAALRLGRLGDAARGTESAEEVGVGSLLLRGEVCDALGRMEEAEAAFAAAVRRNGNDATVRKSYAFHLLKAGRVLDGLSNWSLSDALAGDYPLRRHRPTWTGEPLGSRHIMVLFEHGLGDMIQMARFLPRLRAEAPEALISGRVPAPLLGLLARAFPSVRFVTDDEREPDYDVFVPSTQLPAVLGVGDLEPRSHYLELDASRTGSGAPRGRPRIGVCWRGHPRQYELTRSIPLELFATLFDVPGLDFVVLLNRLTPEENGILRRIDRVAIPPIGNFLDLATAVASCDLVVSVDTAVPHLAAAGGAPVLLLSRPDGCWRWGVSGPASPWYETVEVLRHDGDMNWPRMLAEVTKRLCTIGRSATSAGN